MVEWLFLFTNKYEADLMNNISSLQDAKSSKTAALIVAHPDDETLWAGGTILGLPKWQWYIVCLCRGSDKERARKFYRALRVLKSDGIMGDLDDGPEQKPLDENEVQNTILSLLPKRHFDLIISHNPNGEYTRHIRHEETGTAVIKLWDNGLMTAKEVWIFAYEDGGKAYHPRPIEDASIYITLTKNIWLRKYHIITDTYGFQNTSYEARTTPKAEAFWQLTNSYDTMNWLNQSGKEIN
ncbi:MAG: PIG-L family deacetylase [Bacteroidales bacterium]|nr:PIG-L family deacetylase [Bacteroidales bacterium]